MQACDDRIGDLVDLADGALDEARRVALESHVASCDGCREELAGLRSVGQVLRATSTTVDDFHLSGFARRTSAAAETFRDRSARGLFWSLTRGVRLALVGSFGALALATLLFVGARGGAPDTSQPFEIAAESATGSADETWVASVTADDEDDLAEASVSLDSAFDTLSDDDLDLLDERLDDDAS